MRTSIIRTAFLLMLLIHAATMVNGQTISPSRSGYAPVNGTKIYYEVYGEGRPLILLHGAFYTIGLNWSELIPALSKNRKLIAIEMQGHGHSPFTERKLSLATMASDVEKVMDHLNIDSADVAGYSMGASVAYQFAVQSPARLRKLVIISGTYHSRGWLPVVNGAFKDFKPEFFDNTPLKTAYDAVAPDRSNWRKFLTQMFAFIEEPFDAGDANIAKLSAPVLIIVGDNDGLDKVELMKTYQLLGGGVSADIQPMPRSQLAILPSQGHVSVMMQTTTILAYLNNFLN